MIVGCKYFSSACYLVEISTRANITLENMYFCREHVVHPRKEILVLLKILREPSMFVEEDRINILKRLAGVVVRNDKIFRKNQDCLCLSMGTMISNKVSGMIESSTNRWNRSDTRNKSVITYDLRIKRGTHLSSRQRLKDNPRAIKHEWHVTLLASCTS